MRNPIYWLLTLTLVFGLLLAACAAPAPAPAPSPAPVPAPTPAPTPAAPAATTDQQVIDAAKKEGEVVIWTNTITDLPRIEKQFHEKYPFLKLKVWDARASAILAKLAEEAKVGKFTADFVSTSLNDQETLMNLGLIQEYDWPAITKRWTNQPTHDYYRVHITNFKLPVYNTDLVSSEEAPKTYDDLKDPKWRGKTIMSISGDMNPLQLAYLWREDGKLNWDKSESFWKEVIQNVKPRAERGYPVELIASGEASLFISSASITAQTLMDLGSPLAFAPIPPVVSTPFAMSVTLNPPHPNAVKLFVENLTSPEGLLVWSEANRSLVFDAEVAKKSRIHKIFGGFDTFIVPTEFMTEENQRRSGGFWLRELGLRG